MLTEYVVLKTAHPQSRGGGNLESLETATSGNTDDLQVAVQTLSSNDTQAIKSSQSTRAMAPVMPMRLIQPSISSSQESAFGQSENVAWGIEAVGALQCPFDGSGITVAVLDTGIDDAHPAFVGMDIVQKNFTADDNGRDVHGHGTHCAGTIFGRSVNGTRIGVAPGVTRALIGKVLGETGSSSAILADAIQWAVAEGAHVISMSLGIDFPGAVKDLVTRDGLDERPATSIALQGYRANIILFSELFGYVRARGKFAQGCVTVAASGNESMRPGYTIAVSPPAASDGIVSVGAVKKAGSKMEVAQFSNTDVDICAPGVDILSAKIGGELHVMDGTSMATPHVAGVAALWAQKSLIESGSIGGEALSARLLSSGNPDLLVENSNLTDVGQGFVQAPTR